MSAIERAEALALGGAKSRPIARSWCLQAKMMFPLKPRNPLATGVCPGNRGQRGTSIKPARKA